MAANILIVGTGIAGLGAAIALSKKGQRVTILEATSLLRPLGGIIALQANGNRVLDYLGAYETLASYRWPMRYGPSTRSYKTGDCLCTAPEDAHEKEYGYPHLALHRADLQQVLYETALTHGITPRFGCQAIAIVEEDDRVVVKLKNGEEISADVVIGADGINSVVRRSIVPDHECIRDTGLDITRATIPAEVIAADPQTSMLMHQIDTWCGPNTSVASMIVRRGDKWLLGLDCCHGRSKSSSDLGSHKQDLEHFRSFYKDFAPSMTKLLSYVKEAYVWKLEESRPALWVGGKGRTVLIGDAAHGTLPWIGQGGSMALEDAVTLAECLSRAQDVSLIPEALHAFQRIRQPRCQRVQEWSVKKGQRVTMPDGPQQRARDDKLRLANAWVKAEQWDGVHIDAVPELEAPHWKAWLSGHDALGFAKRELDKYNW